MRVWKIVSGILNCILFVFALSVLSSMANGTAPELYSKYNFLSITGLAVFILVGGITSIVSNKSISVIMNIVLAVIYLPAFILSFYNKLTIWMIWTGICFIVPWGYAQMIRRKDIDPTDPRQLQQPQQPQQQSYKPQQPSKPQPKYQGAPRGSISSIAHQKLDDK
jgi:predicted membrane protein